MSRGGSASGYRPTASSGLLDTLADRIVIPKHIEAEEALLGAMMANPPIIELIVGRVGGGDFHFAAHGRIFDAVTQRHGAGQSVNPAIMHYHFLRDGDLDDVGGADYVLQLAAAPATVENAIFFAGEIRDAAIKRRLIDAALLIAERAGSPETIDTAASLIDEAEAAFGSLAPEGFSRRGLRPFADVVSDLHGYWSDVDAGRLKPIETGLLDLDKQLGGLLPGDVCVLAGRPGMGKSVGLRTAIANVARAGKPVALFSQEMTDMQVAMGIVQQHGPAVDPAGMRRGDIPRDVMTRLVQYSTEIRSLPIWIDDSSGLTIESFRSRIRALKRERPDLALVGIDYLQLMSPPQTREMSGTQGVEYLSKNIKITAKEEKVAIVLLSQLNRAVESRDGKRPTMADLRSSGSIEQDADSVVLIFREEYYHQQEMPTSRTSHDDGSFQRWETKMEEVRGVAEMIVAKNRFGTPGVVRIHFDGARGLFTNAAPSYLNGRGATKPNGQWHDEDWRE